MKNYAVLPLLLLLLFPLPSRAGEPLPFGPGEKLFYDIHWAMILAGHAQLRVKDDGEQDGKPATYFWAKARTAGWVDGFYKVRDVMEAWTDPSVTHALRYKKDQHEGDYRKKVDLIFDKDKNVSYRYARGKLQHTIDQPVDVFDPMSVLFYFRKFPLHEGMEFDSNVTDGKISVVGKAYVEGRETVETDLGSFDTYKVRLDIKHLSGVFKKSKDAALYVWFTADERRLPVKVWSKVAVGSFTMTLVEYHPPQTHILSSE